VLRLAVTMGVIEARPHPTGARPLRAQARLPHRVDLTVGDWQLDALCAEPHYIGLPWFPEVGDPLDECLAVCGRCLVRAECLAFAMGDPCALRHGIWGGTLPGERNAGSNRAA
jgi:WhiB family redox-sensing transcriptional regulator